MTEQDQIQYLTHSQVDKFKWDQCIDSSPNGLIYAYSFYLDATAKQWDALVLNDYEAVMPLPWNKKFGFHYLYQPAFTAQLGVFGKNPDQQLIKNFIQAIPMKFRLIEIALNSGNTSAGISDLRSNYILNLIKPYPELETAYRENHLRNIKKSCQAGCRVKKDIPVDEIIRLNREQMKHSCPVKDSDYENFKKLFYLLKESKQAETYAMMNQQNEILASCVFFFSHNRAYYILVGNTPDGKTIGASHALIDAFIKENAGKNLLLDFEGSDIHNLAFFYGGFGARHNPYPFLKINKLPFYLKWLKK